MTVRSPWRRFFPCLMASGIFTHGFLWITRDCDTGTGRGTGRFLPERMTLPKHKLSSLLCSSADPANEPLAGFVGDETTDPRAPAPVVDVAIVGAGLGGLCAGAILNTVYGQKVAIFESHYVAGGCAHAFNRTVVVNNTNDTDNGFTNLERKTYTFDSGPTILLGCSSRPFNALRQVLDAVGQPVEWIPYTSWGMIERRPSSRNGVDETNHNSNSNCSDFLRWKVQLGPDAFMKGPLLQFGRELAVSEYRALQTATKPLLAGAAIPAVAMRAGPSALLPLLSRYPSTMISILSQGDTLTGTFAPFMDGPLFTVTSPWLRNWLDALAFSLSGLPASRTAAAAMAFMLNDMHRMGAALDYPVGGMGAIVEALVRAVEQGGHGSKVHLGQPVESIDCDEKDSSKVGGITVRCGLETRQISARNGVICNAPVWSLRSLIKDSRMQQILNNGLPLSYLDEKKSKPSSWTTTQDGSSINLSRRPLISDKSSWLAQCDIAEMTGSFMHLHLVINATGLNLDEMEAHYTFMDRSLAGDGSTVNGVLDGPCAMSNMIAVSNPSVLLDRNNSDNATLLIHAYCAGNEPFELWESIVRNTQRYNAFKEERASALWRAVESVIPNAREENRVLASLTGSPLTHARFLRRPRGSYGSATEDYLPDGRTPIRNLFLASDGVFPGIGIPAVAIAGASAANSLINVWEHCRRLDDLYRDDRLSS